MAGFLNGPGFEKMRDDLAGTCSEIWVVDCSPEGHQPEVATRIFQGVQQPVCIVLAARKLAKSDKEPARVRFHASAKKAARREIRSARKIVAWGSDWTDCPSWLARSLLAGSDRRVGDVSDAQGFFHLRRLGRYARSNLDHSA